MFLAVVFGMFFVMLSMAEMASMAPTAGGQFFWVSEFAPRQYQKVLSYTVGWFCVLGWQSALVLTAYSVAQQVEALISLCDVDYTIRGWQGTLLTMPITLFAIMLNTLLARRLPILQNIAFALHTAGFFVLIAVFWALGPHNDPAIVLSDFSETTGWSSVGLACLVSLVGPINTLVGADSSCHLSEELVNASYVLPRAMLTTAIINYTMGFVMTITLMLNLGDVATALASPTGQPYVQVLLDVTGSKGAAITLTALVCVLLLVCTVNGVTTSSRQLFAFALRPGWDIPVNAVLVTMAITSILSLIIIGSSVAFSVLMSLSLPGLLSSYWIVITVIFAKRFRKEPFPKSQFNLGRFGWLANGIALAWLTLVYVMMFFPSAPYPDVAGMNWSVLIYCCVIVCFGTFYYFKARHRYAGPVALVKQDI
ncbi:hypothetical protein BT93_L4792 [Corymbia citriodora subsp. variegata]|uniref:Amino acid transporter n=1 Tax=Corymbia citriodora subsp. variegata TaxID=360336 RepID=A0A8T0CGI1_CORYI|nr:hypothetical protein BT93_L4792 [Corymbia citriodora subsp. variegata]